MCCVFTCCGWVTDLFQRCWTFAMSCLISSAVCCAFLTAAMSGVALGYNYSLAEYIENKETNVSVYLKRGVFDDEVVNELDWRRGGGGIPAPEKLEQGLERSGGEDMTPPSSANDFPFAERRVGDAGIFTTTTINPPNALYSFESDDQHRFEGSLLKFTGKIFSVSTPFTVTADLEMEQIFYKCSLWTSFTQKTFSALRVQYNNGFRMLMELSRYCSASGMFAEAPTDDFYAIVRKRATSILCRVRASSNCILKTIVARYDSPTMRHLTGVENYPKDSVEQIKAMQGLLNRRKMQYDFSTITSNGTPLPEVKLVTFDAPTDTTDSTPLDEASQMKIIQKLLNERKMAALKHPPSHTVRPPTWAPMSTHMNADMLPVFGGRRMGGESPPILKSHMDAILQSDEFRNDPPKWYDRKQTEKSNEPALELTRPTSARGIVTPKIIVTTTPPSRGTRPYVETTTEKRFKMVDSDYDSDQFNENEIQKMINEPKDYDYENVKGIPVRKKRGRRGRRGRRDIKDSSTETKPSEDDNENKDSIKDESEKSLFSKASSILKSTKSIFTSDQVKSDISNEDNFNQSTFIGSSSPSTNVISRTFANIESTTETRILKIIKSTVVTS